jgi:hypothetical protein|tara:strand:+ start:52 stop:294 length:243 start_codon:yes stop_codon:yes gene_type:complete
MRIKENKTRISIWNNNKRLLKIELNKLTITNGYPKSKRNLWIVIKFNTINNGLELLSKNIIISPTEINSIKHIYLNKLCL